MRYTSRRQGRCCSLDGKRHCLGLIGLTLGPGEGSVLVNAVAVGESPGFL